MTAITPIDLRELQNAAGAPPFPDSPPNTIYAEDYNPIRDAISKGTASISTKGAVIGSDGLCTLGTTPVNMAAGLLRFENAESEDVQVGYISNDGELGMVRLRADQQVLLAADVDIKHEGSATRSVPETAPTDWHLVTARGAGTVEDFEVFHDGTLEVIRKLQGDWAADKIGSGIIMRYAGGLSRIRMNSAGEPVIEDVLDYDARPITFDNERRIMTGVDVFVSDVIADPLSPIIVTEPTSDPKVKQIGIAAIPSSALAIGAGVDDVNVDNLFAGGGGAGVLAELTTPAEVALISQNAIDIAAIQAELLTVVKEFRTSGGQTIIPDPSTGRITFANSGSVLWDKPALNTIRAVADGGGGGGGAVNSVTGGDGIANIGTAADPILVVDLVAGGGGLVFTGGELELDYAGSGGDLGAAATPARSDHLHDAVYSPLGHTHPGTALISDITYETLDGNGDVGTVANTLAAGDDSRMTNARVPLAHDLDSAHTGTLPAARVDPAFVPANYTPAADTADGHFEGIDDALTPNFVDLADTPADYTGKAGQTPIVNDAETGLEYGAVATGAIEAPYKWSTNTAVTDPGSGFVKVNNADPTVATVVSISNTDRDGIARDGWPFLRIGDAFSIKDTKNSDTHVYVVDGPTTNEIGWDNFPVVHIFTRNGFGNNDRVTVTSVFVGAADFVDLNDTPPTLAGSEGLGLLVNPAGDGLFLAPVEYETFTGFATNIAASQDMIGDGAVGRTVVGTGTITIARLHANAPLAAASSITVTIENLDTAASDTVTISDPDTEEEDVAISVPFIGGEKLRARITGVGGAPGITQLQIELVRV